jgi:hypothetical protein
MQLPRYSDKQGAIRPLNPERLQKERQQSTERATTPEEHKKGKTT